MAIVKTLIVKGVARFLTDAYMSTIRSGIWNGSTIQVGYGGTGVTSAKGDLYTPVFLSSSGIAACSVAIPHNTKDFKINGTTYSIFTTYTGTAPTIFAPTSLAGTGGYILATNSAKTGLEWVAANNHTHSLYVKLDAGAAEQTIKNSISSLTNGSIEIWRATAGGYAMIGFANGTTKTSLGMLGFTEPNKPVFRNTSKTNYLIAHAGNIVNNNISVTWNTETTIATIAGVAIKIKIPANPNVTTSAVVTSAADGTTQISNNQVNPFYNLLEGGTVTRSIQFTSSNITISANAAGAILFTAAEWTGATSEDAGTKGYMPGAAVDDRLKFLRGDGTWVALSDSEHTHSVSIHGNTKIITSSGTVDLGNYVYTAGDSMTGPLNFTNSNTILVTTPGINFGSWARIGANNTGTGIYSIGTIYLRPNQTISNNSFSTTAGVEVTSTTLKYNTNLVAHAGNITNEDATIGTSSTTIATIAGVNITAKIASYSASSHTHSVKIHGDTKTIAASGGTAVDLGNYVYTSGDTMTGHLALATNVCILAADIADSTGRGIVGYNNGTFLGAFGDGTTENIPTFIRSTGNNLYHLRGNTSASTTYLIADAGNTTSSDTTIGTSLTTIASIAGVDIKAKIASYASSSHTHSVIINGATKTIAAPGGTAVNLGSYVLLDAGAAELTIKSSIDTMSKGVINLWRNSGDHFTFLGFSNGTTKTYLGGIGFKSQSDSNLYKRIDTNYYVIADASNVVNNNTTITWNTETTIATIAGIPIKIKIPANSNVTTSAVLTNSASGTTQLTAAQSNPFYNLLEGGVVTRSVQFVAGAGMTVGTTDGSDVKITNTAPIYYIKGNADTTAGTWTGTDSRISAYYEGLTIIFVPQIEGASTTTLNINGLGAKTCYYTGTTKMTTHYDVGTPIMLTYYANSWRRADYNSDSNTWRNVYVNGNSAIGTGIGTKAINFAVAGNLSVKYLAAGTASGQSGNASYFTVKITANANAVGVAGYVAAPTAASNPNNVWMTNASGDPAWRAVSAPATVPTIGTSDTTLATIGGITVKAKIASYSLSNHTHYYLVNGNDSRDVVTIPTDYSAKFTFVGIKNNSTIGISNAGTYSYLIGLRGWIDHSGGGSHELAFSQDLGLFRRIATSDTAWGSWVRIADSGNVSNSAATIGTSLTTIATIAGVSITAKIPEVASHAIQLFSGAKTLAVDSWITIAAVNTLDTGTYAISISSGTLYASGIFTACGGTDVMVDEIVLHVANSTSGQTWRPYARISGNNLEMSSNEATGTERTYTVKILKLI